MNKFIKIIFFNILIFPLLFLNLVTATEKLKIGLLVPITGTNKDLGHSILKAVRLAVKDIDDDIIEVGALFFGFNEVFSLVIISIV